jgi:hypothetical protein
MENNRNVNRNENDVTCQDYNGACAQSLPNEFKSEVNSIWFALLSE